MMQKVARRKGQGRDLGQKIIYFFKRLFLGRKMIRLLQRVARGYRARLQVCVWCCVVALRCVVLCCVAKRCVVLCCNGRRRYKDVAWCSMVLKCVAFFCVALACQPANERPTASSKAVTNAQRAGRIEQAPCCCHAFIIVARFTGTSQWCWCCWCCRCCRCCYCYCCSR